MSEGVSERGAGAAHHTQLSPPAHLAREAAQLQSRLFRWSVRNKVRVSGGPRARRTASSTPRKYGTRHRPVDMETHPPVDTLPKPALADVLERREQAVRVDKVLDVERAVRGDLSFVADLLLDEQHLRNVAHLDALPTGAGHLLAFGQRGEVDELGAVELVAGVEDGPARVLEFEPDVGRHLAALDHLAEVGRKRRRHAQDELLLDGERLVRVAVQLAVPPDRGRVNLDPVPAAVPAATDLELDLGREALGLLVQVVRVEVGRLARARALPSRARHWRGQSTRARTRVEVIVRRHRVGRRKKLRAAGVASKSSARFVPSDHPPNHSPTTQRTLAKMAPRRSNAPADAGRASEITGPTSALTSFLRVRPSHAV